MTTSPAEQAATTDLSDANDGLAYPAPVLSSFGGMRAFRGPMATVRLYEDNVVFVQALESVLPGTVIVVDGGGSTRCALMGDRLAGIAAERGIPGVILNGCVRDTAELGAMPVGVLALAAHPKKSFKRGDGERDVPVAFAGAVWTPGHHVYVDADGVVLSPAALV
jgi:regulator of ribonuclease activity A